MPSEGFNQWFLKFAGAFTDIQYMIIEMQSVQIRPLPIKPGSIKMPVNIRALRIARITRQIQKGTYHVPGRQIAAKLLLRDTGACCST